VLQRLGGQAGSEIPGGGHVAQRIGQKVVRDRRADQESQCILVEGHLARVPGYVDPRRVHPGLGLAEIQIGGGAYLSSTPDHLVGLPLGLEG